jgi:hypothetical protein
MSGQDPKHLLKGYALGGLSAEQTNDLFEASLKDQDLFERLMQEESLRLALRQPGNRDAILAALREPIPSWSERLAAWFRKPAHMLFSVGSLAAVAVVVFAVISLNQNPLTVSLDPTRGPAISMLGIETPDESDARQAALTQLFRISIQQPIPAQLGLNKAGRTPEYRIGEDIRFGLSVRGGGNCLLLDRLEDQPPIELFPNRFITSMLAPGGQTLFVPPAGQGNLSVSGPPGLHRLRLIVVPPDVTLDLSSPAAWSRGATVIERQYKVVPETNR